MTATHVVDLVRRASIIRGIALVLDTEAFADTMLKVSPPVDLRAARIERVSLRIPTRCRVAYRMDVGGRMHDLDVFAGPREEIVARTTRDVAQAIPGPFGPGRILLEDSDVLVSVFPNDHKLRALPRMTDPAQRGPLLRELFPDRPDLWQAEFIPLRYRPERRFVAELRDAVGPRAVVKCCTRHAYGRSRQSASVFRTDGPLRIAGLLGTSERSSLLAYEFLPGHSLFDIVSARDLDRRGLATSGAALAAMHAQRPAGLTDWTSEFQAAHLSAVSREIGFTCPALAARAEALARRLGDRLPPAPVERASIHADMSLRHLLVGERQVGIIDLDWACYGDPADDLGYLVAGVERQVVRGKLPADRADRVREALLEGYGRRDDPDFRRRIDFYTTIGIFQQARFPFRSWAREWPQDTEALLARAETCAERAA